MAAPETVRTAGNDDHIPPEIWREVLSRLPVKSILRCRSVCKSWYSLVSCPSFVSYYSSKTLNKNRNRVLLQLARNRSCELSFNSLDESFMESREHDDFPESHDQVFDIVGSCNGLICFYTKPKYSSSGITFFVWNPTIRKVVELPSRHDREYVSYIGFGFDHKTGDYKVLCVTSNVCEIFDLSKGVWRSIGPLMHKWRVGTWKVPPIRPECYLDGVVHWSRKKRPRCNDMILLSFNISDECFRDIKIPDLTGSQMLTTPETRDNFTCARSMTLGGLIYVYVWDTVPNSSVWVMKEYGVAESWTKVSDMDLHRSHKLSNVSLLWENGEALMAVECEVLMEEEAGGYRYKQNLALYNMKRKRYTYVFSIPELHFVRDMCLYEESLVLM